MTEFEYLLNYSPADLQGETPYNDEELAELRIAAWKSHRVFIIHLLDPRICEDERRHLYSLASRLYGQEGDNE
ncbi:hypothetical protein MLD52_09615 [Puniceicoccaceae bacterium K14]|nr:hypothetical protein [Puniceicoccaceae bacterium K14]